MSQSLYQSALGAEYASLSPTLRRLHDGSTQSWQGEAAVSWGRNKFAHILLRLARLPEQGKRVNCQVDFQQNENGERWQRRFAQRYMQSHQALCDDQLVETFGPLRLYLNNTVSAGGLIQRCVATRFWGLPLPAWLNLSVIAREWSVGEQLHFDVSIGLNGGLELLRYRGHLLQQGKG